MKKNRASSILPFYGAMLPLLMGNTNTFDLSEKNELNPSKQVELKKCKNPKCHNFAELGRTHCGGICYKEHYHLK